MISRKCFNRYDIKTELVLALMPTAIIIILLFLLETFSNQKLLFSSLASSAFLIYLDPKHPTNSIRTLVIAQLSACIIGYGIFLLIGQGYIAASISMVCSIAVMILTKAMHPPAVSTALIFAFEQNNENTIVLFTLAVLLLTILIVLQRATIWIINRADGKNRGRCNLTLNRS